MGLVADLTWEELQEIGVNKLGERRVLWGLQPGAGCRVPARVSGTHSASRPGAENGGPRKTGAAS